MASELVPGAVIVGRYEIKRQLGEGGIGVVWEARDLKNDDAVALKVLRVSLLGRPQLRRRLLREARAQIAVAHPGIVQVRDVLELTLADALGFEDLAPGLVLELLEGETLAALLERRQKLSPGETARVMLPALRAVAAAHERGIVHRDLKPGNLFLARLPDGKTTTKVLDFGVAKLTQSLVTEGLGLTRPGTSLGTVQYMAPEQLESASTVDARADIWSMGAIAYECLSGAHPIAGDHTVELVEAVQSGGIVPLRLIVPDLPDALAEVVSAHLTRNSARRPEKLDPMISVLEHTLSSADVGP